MSIPFTLWHRSCLHRLKALLQPAVVVLAVNAGQQLPSVRPLVGVAHMNPVGVALRVRILDDALVEGNLRVHEQLRHEHVQLGVVVQAGDVCRLTSDVLRVLRTTHRLVQRRAPIARADADGAFVDESQRFQHHFAERFHTVHFCRGRRIVDAEALGRCRTRELMERETYA